MYNVNEVVYMSDELLTVSQTAEYLKVCEKTVRRMIKANMITASKIGGRSWRIRKEDIDLYISQHTNSNGLKGED